MRATAARFIIIGLAITLQRVPGTDIALVERATAQVAFMGGSSYRHTSGFGPFGGGVTYTGGTYINSPAMAFGTLSTYPYGIPNIAAPYNGVSYGASPFIGYYGGGAAYGAYGGYPYGNWGGYYGRPYYGGYTMPPVIMPAETMYGPGAVRRMMGLDAPLGTPIVNNLPIANNPAGQPGLVQPGAIQQPAQQQPAQQQPGGFGVNAPGVQVPRAAVAPTNQAARERAKRQLEVADGWFRKQQYGDAWIAYKEAARAAPDVADAYFHQAAAAVAQKRYEAAVDAVKYGLRVSTAYVDGEFRYSKLYGDNKLALTAHREALAQAATDQPSSDLYFLTGVMLFFDEEPLRSAPFFAKAREVQAGETWHIDVFREILRRMEAKGPAANAPLVVPPPAANPPAANPPAANPPPALPPKQAKAEAAGLEI